MAPLSRRGDPALRPVVFALSDLLPPHVGNDAGTGLQIDPSCIWRWVQQYGPELEQRCRPHLKPINKSHRVDENHIKVKEEDRYLYRAVDSTGQTNRLLIDCETGCCRCQTLLSKGSGRPEQSPASSHQCGQRTGLRPSGHGVEVRRSTSKALSFAQMQVLKQHRGARPSNGSKSGYGWQKVTARSIAHGARSGVWRQCI
jgi:hypothetical protein